MYYSLIVGGRERGREKREREWWEGEGGKGKYGGGERKARAKKVAIHTS